jgi:hypothetical protein
MEEQRFMVCENRMRRRIFGPKRDEVTKDWRKIHSEASRNLYTPPNIIIVIKYKRIRWAEYVARKRNILNA